MTLWGISYGSHLALAALNEIPSEIDRIVIASAEGLDQTVKLPGWKPSRCWYKSRKVKANQSPFSFSAAMCSKWDLP